MSPTIFREGEYRFFFFSREETRMHVHVHHETGEAKIWMVPEIAAADRYGLSDRRLKVVLRIVQEHEHEIRAAGTEHFGA